MAAEQDQKSWWERNVEDSAAHYYDQQRALVSEYDTVGRLEHDVKVGAMKGAYGFAKGLVVGVADVAAVGYKLYRGDPETSEKAWQITKKVAKESWVATFGGPDEKRDQNERTYNALREVGKGVYAGMKKDWAQAEHDGKRAELISKWGTEGVLNIASFFVGAGEVRAAAGAGKAGELLEAGSVLARVKSECPLARTLESIATREVEQSAEALRRLPATGAGSFSGPADEAYAAIRASTTDVESIARNTGIKPENIQKVKNHIFHEEHLLDRYADIGEPAQMARFDSDAGIAAAWKRLEQGNFTPSDIQLLKHETAEAWYMRKNGPSYNAAHNAAQARYPAPDLGE